MILLSSMLLLRDAQRSDLPGLASLAAELKVRAKLGALDVEPAALELAKAGVEVYGDLAFLDEQLVGKSKQHELGHFKRAASLIRTHVTHVN